jgi:hypothetical protein
MNFSNASFALAVLMELVIFWQLFFTHEPKNIEMRFPSLSIRHRCCLVDIAHLALEFLIRRHLCH